MHLGFLPLRSASALLVRRCSGLASDAAFVASAERVRVYAHLHRQHPAAKELTDLANTLELLQRRPADPTTIQIRTNVMASLSAILAQMHEPSISSVFASEAAKGFAAVVQPSTSEIKVKASHEVRQTERASKELYERLQGTPLAPKRASMRQRNSVE